jgi:hypothetical protein
MNKNMSQMEEYNLINSNNSILRKIILSPIGPNKSERESIEIRLNTSKNFK